MRTRILFFLCLFWLCVASPASHATDFVVWDGLSALPKDRFIFGLYNTESKQLALGWTKDPASRLRNGGHFRLFEEITGTSLPEWNAGAGKLVGRGTWAGFGFRVAHGHMVVHPLSSLKSGVFNSKLPHTAPGLSGLLVPKYADPALTLTSHRVGLPMMLDNDLAGSSLFPLNAKHLDRADDLRLLGVAPADAERAALAGLDRVVRRNALTLPLTIMDANSAQFPLYRIAEGMHTPNFVAVEDQFATMGTPHRASAGKAVSTGVDAWFRSHVTQPRVRARAPISGFEPALWLAELYTSMTVDSPSTSPLAAALGNGSYTRTTTAPPGFTRYGNHGDYFLPPADMPLPTGRPRDEPMSTCSAWTNYDYACWLGWKPSTSYRLKVR